LSGEQSRVLAEEQAALRRVATLVARGVPPAEVFAAVTEEVGRLFPVEWAHLGRYEPAGAVTIFAGQGKTIEPFPVGRRWSLGGKDVATIVFQTGRPARVDSFADASGQLGVATRDAGIGAGVGTPVIVEGHLWGVMAVHSTVEQALPADTEARLVAFTELVATAISNADARAELGRLAEEQTALRRVATLVAQGVAPADLCGAVAAEVGTLLGVDLAGMVHYEADDTVRLAATWAGGGEQLKGGRRLSLEGDRLATSIAATARPAREDTWADVRGPIAHAVRDELGVRSSVGSPIIVEGRVWGALLVHSRQTEALPADTESRLMNFTELLATSVSNAHARAEVQRLADEQAALRRVATLVAHQSPPEEVFAAVAEEVGRLLHIEATTMFRYEDDGTASVVAAWGEATFPVGWRSTLEGENVAGMVLHTGRPARIDDYTKATGSIAAGARALGNRSVVGCPIVVDGRLWGAMITPSQQAEPLPPDTESRIAEFTELVATAISNIQARSDLAASRARIVAATDEEHRRVVRDLHDGAQQCLLHTIFTLKRARSALQNEDQSAPALLAEALEQAKQANDELRELAHGILPAALARGGLRAGVDALAARMPVPIDNGVAVGRLPDAVEATAYFVVAEALTNVAKHARAERAAVTARIEGGTLRLEVRDDGVGGARPEGSGLVGLADRVAALDGRLRVESPADGGTLVAAAIPLHGALGSVTRSGGS